MRISIFLFILGSILILAPLLGSNITGNIAKTPESINSSRIMYGVGILAILSGALNEIKKKFEKKFKGDHKATLIGEIHEVGNYWLLEGYSTDEIKKLNKIIPKIKEEEIKILKKVKPDTVYLETTEEELEQLKDYLPETYKLVEKLKESDIKVLPLEESYHKYLYDKICDKKKESYNIMNLFKTLSNVERYLKLLKISGKKLTKKRLKEKIGILPLLN
ncbi:MAG: hypothetical protein J7L39_00925, partial [Candidatus Aenigmarchaeota archaeon]|nr:hypothetical protein [Candidatus Aenigmarchaeota archaeon]